MEHLIVRLLERDPAEPQAEWALFRDGRKAAGEGGTPLSAVASRIPPHADAARRVSVFVPGPQVNLIQVNVLRKHRRHLDRMLPFLAEEQLAEEVGLLHFARAAQEDGRSSLSVAVVRKAVMQRWLGALREAAVTPQIMLPETLALPCRAQGWRLLLDGGMAWLRASSCEAFAVEQAMLSDLLGLLLTGKPPASVPLDCVLCGPEPTREAARYIAQLQHAFPALSVEVNDANSAMDFLCESYLGQPEPGFAGINLLQGEFTPQADSDATSKIWRRMAQIAAAWFVLQMAVDGGQAAYFSRQSDSLRAQTGALYRQLFPQEARIVDPLAQMKSHLSSDAQGGGQGFLPMLQRLGARWQAAGSAPAQMESVSYRQEDRALALSVTAGSLEAVNSLAQHLNGQGLNAKMLSVTNSADGVKGQLSVKESGNE